MVIIMEVKLTKITITKDFYNTMQLIYDGKKIKEACSKVGLSRQNFYYGVNQLYKYYNVKSLSALIHTLVQDGLIKG